MKPLIISLFDEHPLVKVMLSQLDVVRGHITLRDFPDEETYVQFHDVLENRDVIILASLDRPNPKMLPLLFIAETARALGAKRVGLCAPYLAYMRQDKQFKAGEGITSEYFSAFLSRYFDWLVTVDPHLHRHHDLNEIYSIPSVVLHAAIPIAAWIANDIKNPVLIGPDVESEQWVSVIAQDANAPYLILEKIRHGDREVEVSHPELVRFQHHTPVLIDDIISTAETMLETIKYLKQENMAKPVCIGVHAIFADDAYERLMQAGVAQVLSCNSIPHVSNQIDLSSVIVEGIRQQLYP